MNDEDQKLVVSAALEEAFHSQVSKLFAVYFSDPSPDGLQRFMAGLARAMDALASIEQEL